jgi:Divergent InlB B-repeat domain
MRVLRVLSSSFAILLLAIATLLSAPVGAANPQQAATSPQSKSDGVAAPNKERGGDPDLPKRARPQQAPPPFTGPYAPGEVFVSDGMGLVDVFKPDGTLLGSLNSGQPLTAGMSFAQTGNLYVTTFSGLDVSTPPTGVVEFDINGNLVGPFGNFPAADDDTAFPESILFNQAGNAFVGAATEMYLDGCSPPDVTSGPVPAFEFDKNGNLLNTFTVAGQCRGTDWVELLADQQTLLYTSEGTSVLSFNINTNTQNADFADNLPGSSAYAFRVLPNGNLLVADSTVVVELNASGAQVMTYTPNPAAATLFALNLDPDGTSFWTADLETGTVYRFDIASGTQLVSFTTSSSEASGVAIFGEKLVGTNNLMVTDMGTGTGTVTSSPSGISCPSSCLAPFSDNSNVTLTATAAEGSTFSGFSSNCVPASPQTNPPTCVVPIGTADVTVTATFNSGSGLTLTVTKAGTGSGIVTSSPAGISCGSTCSASFASGAQVTLTANPADGSTFAGWSGGGCTGTGTCVVTLNAATTVTATFNSNTNGFALTVAEAGTGTGTVTSAPAGISCPTTCSANFASGAQVTLTASAATGSTFAGWSGGGCTGTGTCVVTVTAATSVTATFNSSSPVTIGIGQGSSSTVTTTPGSSAVFGLVLTALPGTTGTVQLTCSSPVASITCNIVPSSITLTGKAINVAIVVETFCKGSVPNFVPMPRAFGTGLGLLLATLCLGGMAGTYKRQPRWAVSFGLLIIFAVGMTACSNVAKSPSGSATPPGNYPLTVTATAPNGATSSVNLTLVVK